MNELSQQILKANGQSFVLSAKVEIVKKQRDILEKQKDEFQKAFNKDYFEAKRNCEELNKLRAELEVEIRKR